MSEDPELAPETDARASLSGASWVEAVTGSTVERSAGLIGGMSSEVTRHELADGRAVVSRHITNAAWLEREPLLIENEATALRLLADAAFAAPRLIATAPGQLLMSFVDGEMRTSTEDLRRSAASMAQLALDISAVGLPPGHTLPPWRPWADDELSPPDWGDQALWADGIAAFCERSQPTVDRPVLLHRDLHPLNVLWEGDNVHVVDWVNACVGHPHAELGHCRWNLAVLADLECADHFLDAYLGEAHRLGPYDPYWDLAPLMSFLPGPLGGAGWRSVGRVDLTPERVVERTESFLRSALARA